MAVESSTRDVLPNVIPSTIRSSMLLSGASLYHSQTKLSELFTRAAGLTRQDMSMESMEVVGVGMLVVPLRLQSGSWARAQQSTAAANNSEDVR